MKEICWCLWKLSKHELKVNEIPFCVKDRKQFVESEKIVQNRQKVHEIRLKGCKIQWKITEIIY